MIKKKAASILKAELKWWEKHIDFWKDQKDKQQLKEYGKYLDLMDAYRRAIACLEETDINEVP